jgi:hypothetical protein
MYRFMIFGRTIFGCSLILLGSPWATGFAADAKPAARNSLLAKRGLTQFDLDGNGTLDASERAAALAARRSGHSPSSDSMAAGNSTGYPYYPSGYQFNDGGYPYGLPRASRTNLPGGLQITPTNSPQTVWAFCRPSGQYMSLTVSQGMSPVMAPPVNHHGR